VNTIFQINLAAVGAQMIIIVVIFQKRRKIIGFQVIPNPGV
jgi:hypothetical protein